MTANIIQKGKSYKRFHRIPRFIFKYVNILTWHSWCVRTVSFKQKTIPVMKTSGKCLVCCKTWGKSCHNLNSLTMNTGAWVTTLQTGATPTASHCLSWASRMWCYFLIFWTLHKCLRTVWTWQTNKMSIGSALFLLSHNSENAKN